MADRIIEHLVYKLIADETALVKSLKESTKKLDALGDSFIKTGKKATLGLTVPIVAAGTAMVMAAVESERAVALLESAIEAVGNTGKVSAANLAKYADELSLVSKYDDEATLSAFTLLEQMTALDEKGLKALMPSIQNLAAAKKIDLVTAADLVGKTIGTETNALARQGIEIEAGSTKAEKMAQVLKGLARYNGFAAAEAQTFSGKLAILKNQVDNVAEQFGNELLPIISEVVSTLGGVVKQFSAMSPEMKRSILGVAGVAAAIGPMLIGIGNAIKMVSTLKTVMAGLSIAGGGPVALAIAGISALAIGMIVLAQKSAEAKKKQKEFWDIANQTEEQLQETIDASQKMIDQYSMKDPIKNIEKMVEASRKLGFSEAELADIRKTESEDLALEIALNKSEIDKYVEHQQKAQAQLKAIQDQKAKAAKRAADEARRLEKEQLAAEDAEKRYADALEIAANALEKNRTETQSLMAQIELLKNLKTTSYDDENTRLLGIASLRKQLFQIEKKQLDDIEAERVSQREKDIAYNEELKQAGREAAEEGDAERKQKIQDQKDSISKTSGYVQMGLESVSAFSKIIQTDISESWDDLADEVLTLTAEIAKSTQSPEGMVVAAVADALNLVVDIVDGIINYEKNVALEYADTINSVNVSILDNKIKLLDDELKATLATIDAEEKAALEKAGFIDDTEVQALEKKLAEETDVETRAAIEKEIAKAKIEEEYQKKRDAANEKAEKERRKLEHDRAIWERDIMLAKIQIEKEKAISELGWFNKDKKASVEALYGGLISSVNSIPIPALARGGSFTVPAGFEQDSFPIPAAMVSSGERVTVETPEQQIGGSGINLYIDNFFGDDASYRQLERKLSSLRPLDALRRG